MEVRTIGVPMLVACYTCGKQWPDMDGYESWATDTRYYCNEKCMLRENRREIDEVLF